jgi:hypothetical protein
MTIVKRKNNYKWFVFIQLGMFYYLFLSLFIKYKMK